MIRGLNIVHQRDYCSLENKGYFADPDVNRIKGFPRTPSHYNIPTTPYQLSLNDYHQLNQHTINKDASPTRNVPRRIPNPQETSKGKTRYGSS